VKITVYTQLQCQPCTAVKRWLDRRGIAYTAVSVSESPEGLAYVKSLGYLRAPVTVISERGTEPDLHWPDFNPNNMTKYIAQKAA